MIKTYNELVEIQNIRLPLKWFRDQIAESKVVDVIWSPSKDGYLKPKVQLQPVESRWC